MDGEQSSGLLYEREAFQIRGAAFEVYRAMGAGFLEGVYRECLEIEFSRRGVPFETHRPLKLSYLGAPLKQTYVADFVCFDRIVIELKSVRALAPEHRAQTVNYLRVTAMKLGLLINFGSMPKIEIERFVV